MVDFSNLPGAPMRIKLKSEQLNILAKGLRFEVILQQPRDVRGMLEVLGKEMPWEETGLNKFDSDARRPIRLTFSVEEAKDGYICDIHPALAQYIHTLLSAE
jgi:hypothetical protein